MSYLIGLGAQARPTGLLGLQLGCNDGFEALSGHLRQQACDKIHNYED
ncbi:MAG: hypothetical protein ACOYEV_11595 [Candidatus Nanopelagicales bacterium]